MIFSEHLAELAKGGKASYLYNIRVNVRALWTGVYGLNEFYDGMVRSLEKGIYKAFEEAFAKYGMTMDELTPDEKGAMFNYMYGQSNYIERFGQSIFENSKTNGGKLGQHFTRVEKWASRYEEANNLALNYAAKNQHLMWVLGPTVDHCISCLKLAGKVKRGNVWLSRNIRPQSPNLACGGWGHCYFVPTTQPASRGPLPSIP